MTDKVAAQFTGGLFPTAQRFGGGRQSGVDIKLCSNGRPAGQQIALIQLHGRWDRQQSHLFSASIGPEEYRLRPLPLTADQPERLKKSRAASIPLITHDDVSSRSLAGQSDLVDTCGKCTLQRSSFYAARNELSFALLFNPKYGSERHRDLKPGDGGMGHLELIDHTNECPFPIRPDHSIWRPVGTSDRIQPLRGMRAQNKFLKAETCLVRLNAGQPSIEPF